MAFHDHIDCIVRVDCGVFVFCRWCGACVVVLQPVWLAVQRPHGHWCVVCGQSCDWLCTESGEKVTVNDYQSLALRTANDLPHLVVENPLLLDGVMGLAGEAGEALDIFKKHLMQGHPLDTDHLVKELGDVAWYLAVSAYALGCDLETVFRKNIEKLRERYPNGFDPEYSRNRKEGDV